MSYPVPMAALGMSSGVIIEDGSQLLQNLELGSALLNVLFTIYDVDEKIAAARTHPQGHPSTMRYGPPSSSASTSSPPSSSSSSFSSSSSPSPSYTSSSDASSASSHSSSYYSSHLASSSQSITSFEYDGGATVLTPPRPSSEEDSSFLIQSQAERLHVVLDAVSSVGNGGNGTSASTSLSPMVHLLIGAEQVFEPSLVYLLALEIYEQAAVDDHKVAHAVQDGRELPPVTRCQSLTQNERFYRVVMDGVDGLGDPEEDGTGIRRWLIGISTRKRVYRVVAALIRQADIDFHREIVAWKSQQVIPDRTYCQLLVEHPLFVTLFTMACKAYRVELRRQIAMVQMAQAAAKMKARAKYVSRGVVHRQRP
ncbi:hypothetical protein CC1G_02088 [Coprinopsis cinerea okayama7|uniref:Uncharacterized protein n=1 Tax=Coprinopsis cinerea (strain Okayama-7 / 130 / ATCC MYA-4618 / FGSC 9003) TaxID=240176 RepID=A8NK51_COPC7|nr:hypothetical protein CC1G_02088 [Coprinopsis cinerea okayama7\|eukprot:XP_001834352.2 hypothetical protein CC1G_02088 [Coprinopsis cinerea okayama7\